MKPGLIAALLIPAACGSAPSNSFVGFVDSPTSAVASMVAGQVLTVDVHEGDTVKQGQVLATLDARERTAMVAQAQANLDRAQTSLAQVQANQAATSPTVRGAGADVARAQAALDDAKKADDRAKALVAGGAMTAADMDSAEARLRQAQASLDSLVAGKDAASGRLRAAVAAVADSEAAVKVAEAALDTAKVQLSEAQILSPCDGLVVDRNLEPGEWASPGMPVVTVEDNHQRWVRIDVEETHFAGLKVGDPATVSVEALPGKTFKGHILEVGAEADFALNRDVKRGRPDLRTFRVRVGIDEGSDALRPGMTAEVALAPGT